MPEKITEIMKLLKKQYPEAKIALGFRNPLQLLVATILSAQCTDRRVNMVTPQLFKKYKTTKDYANADITEFEQEIRTTGFYHSKAKNIINTTKVLNKKFGGKVPKTMDELLTLPGVARKTANVVLTGAYGVIEGIVVDTHVRRLSGRLGLTKKDDPVKIEQDLMKLIPKKEWTAVSNLLIFHGRNICYARNPGCSGCILEKLCPKIGL